MAKEFSTSMKVALRLACCLVLAGSAGISLAVDKPHLAGSWSFNQDQSDDASKKIHEAQQTSAATRRGSGAGSPDEGYPGGGYPGGGYPGSGGLGIPTSRGGIGAGPMGGGRVGRGPIGRVPDAGSQGGGIACGDLEALASNAKMLRIEQSEQRLSITDNDGHTRTLYPDGKKHKEQESGDKTATVKTHWDGDRLVAESKIRSGKLTEAYELSPDGNQLYVTSRLNSSHFSAPLTIRRVYDTAAANPQ